MYKKFLISFLIIINFVLPFSVNAQTFPVGGGSNSSIPPVDSSLNGVGGGGTSTLGDTSTDPNNGPIGPPQSNGNFSTNGQAGQGQVDATLCTNFTGALGGSPKLKDLFDFVTCMIIRSIIPLVFGIAILIFIWGVVQFIGNGDNEEKRKKGKTFMIWGIIAITVMVSIWGFVAMLGKSFGVDNAIPRLAEPKNP